MKLGLSLAFLLFTAVFLPAVPVTNRISNSTNVASATNLNKLSTNNSARLISANADWLKRFQVKRGFYLEQVASEMLVANPVAMTFDENGRMYVLEAVQNPVGNEASQGRVRLLEDSDGNGVFDNSVIFADNVTSPSALICYDGGIFVAAGGQILYFKDVKGVAHADTRREVFKSFGDGANGNSGGVFISGMTWGLDNRIHVSTSSHGGDVISSSFPVQSITLTNGNFSFDPHTLVLRAETGSGPAGMTFDDRGRKFVGNPTQPLSLVMYNLRYASHNPLFQMPEPVLSLPAAVMADMIYPSPFETSHNDATVVPIIPFSTNPTPFSSAISPVIYRGTAYPTEDLGDAFVIDKIAGVVHHEKLRGKGLGLTLERPADEQGLEFITARGSFEPTQIVNSPDGVLYMAGSFVQASTNKTGPSSRSAPTSGRIYRILPDNFKQPVPPKLSTADVDRLVLMLRHPNGWYRDTSARLLFERQNRAAIVPLVRLFVDLQSLPLARTHALHALDGISMTADGKPGRALLEPHVIKAMSDPDDRVREHGILLAEEFINARGEVSDALWLRITSLGSDPSPQVRYQLALTMGLIQRPGKAQILAPLLQSDPDDPWMSAAILSSLNEGAGELFSSLANDANLVSRKGGELTLHQLVTMIGEKNQDAEVQQALRDLQNITDARMLFGLIRSMDNGLQRAGSSLATVDANGSLKPIYSRAETLALDVNTDEPTRIAAMRLVSIVPLQFSGLTTTLLLQWPSLSPTLQGEALRMLLAIPEAKQLFLSNLQSGSLPRGVLSSVQIRMLLADRNPDYRQAALNFLGSASSGGRQQSVDNYRPALGLTGDANRGRGLFVADCLACHRSAIMGNTLGVPLANSTNLNKELMLTKILDPNHDISPNPATVIETMRGERVLGFVAAQTTKCFKVLNSVGLERDIARSDIRYQDSLGVSIMPEGMESVLSQQNMADLLEYLASRR